MKTPRKNSGPRRKNMLKARAAERALWGKTYYENSGSVSKHAHGPHTEIEIHPPRTIKRQRFDTYLRPDGMPIKLTKGALVCALIYDYPQLSDAQIARLAGVNKRSLYKFPFFVEARRAQDLSGKRFQGPARVGEMWGGEIVIKE